MNYKDMNSLQLEAEKQKLWKKYKEYQNLGLTLNMARGKPSPEQLEISMPMLDIINSDSDCRDKYGIDCRNYGNLLGINEARDLFSELMGISPRETIVVGSSSLTFMYDSICRAMLLGVLGSEKPWCKYDKIKFICPVPGYDRHFTICESLGIEMVSVALTETGPDMDAVRSLVENDETVKGMWIVPKYSNPLGSCYSDDIIRQLASLKPAAKDFRIFCDNAYMVHTIYDDVPVLNILEECKKAGNPNMVFVFGSTSKITFPGAGVAYFGASEANIRFIEGQISAEAISWDKMNMLRHVRFFGNTGKIMHIMHQQAEIMRPKFDAALGILDKNLSGLGCGSWVKPQGGYFITFLANPGCATRIHTLCKACGLTMTPPGATHPYHKDPQDSYLRIAPSFPSEPEVCTAMEIFTLAARIATIEQLEKSGEKQ